MLPFEDQLPFEAEDNSAWYRYKDIDPIETALKVPATIGDVILGSVGGAVSSSWALPAYAAAHGMSLEQAAREWAYNPRTEAGATVLKKLGEWLPPIAGHLGGYNPLPGRPGVPREAVLAEKIRHNDLIAREAEVPKPVGKYDELLKTETPQPAAQLSLPFEEGGKPWVSPENLQYKERAIAQQQMAATGRTDLNPFEGPNAPPVMRVERSGQAYEPTMGAEIGRRSALETEQAIRETIGREESTFRQDIGEQLKPLIDQRNDEAFWKARAEQLQREAQAKQAPPETIRAQQQTPFNPYPVAGKPEVMEGLSRSTQDVIPNQVPEGGVIPRDAMPYPGTNEPMLRVPRGNEWVPDENGIPVRQGVPESTVAPDYINPYMRQDEAVRNDLGNAIQEANGPKTGEQDVYGSGQLNTGSSRIPVHRLNKGFGRGQHGGIDVGGFFPKKQPPKPDNITEARSPEVIAAKAELAQKAAALKLKNTQYDAVRTVEEAKAGIDAAHDMSKAGVNNLRSGSEGALRTNIKNKPLNFLRTSLQEARNFAESMSKEYITNKDTGIIRLIKNLDKVEKDGLAEMLLALDRNQRTLTPEVMDLFQMTPGQRAAATRIHEALEARYMNYVDAMKKQGLEPVKPREGYFPSMFSGSYTSLIGYTDEAGKWHTMGIAQADTKFGHDRAVASYKDMGKKYSETVTMPRKGMNQYVGHNHVYDGFTDLIDQMAKLDPDFAKAKAIVDQHTKDQVASLYRFDVHELKKQGVRGSLGDRPWLSKEENTRQMFEGLIDYLEQGFRYDSLQSPLNDLGKLVTDPEMRTKMPNTTKFIEQHIQHVTGTNLNPIGAAVNWSLDSGIAAFQLGPKYPRQVVNAVTQASTSLMMGFGNLGFALLQLSQLPLAAATEGLAFRQVAGLPHAEVIKSFATGTMNTALMALSEHLPRAAEAVPAHMQEAYKWAHEKGMFDYSEAELVHNFHKSTPRIWAEKVVNASISVPEKMTRPPMFMFMADMMHKAGLRGEEALLRAQAATDYAMVNYTHDERPGIYSALGYSGQAIGALSTFKHNLVEGSVSRAVNWRTQPEALAAGAAVAFSLYGAAGFPGYEEANWAVQKLTGKSIREFLMSEPEKPNVAMDGLASWYTGVDIQSRVSASNLLPNVSEGPSQVLPHVGNVSNIISAAYDAAMKQDLASLQNFTYKALPASMRNVYEGEVLTDSTGQVFDTKGNKKTELPRSEEETKRREWIGLRPLRERLDSETLWTQKQRSFDIDKKMKAVQNDFATAVRLNQPLKPYIDKWVELGGDPNTLLNSIEKIKEEGAMTPKQRAQGIPNDSLQSLQRYKRFND